VVGALFSSNGFQRGETELVIVITPYLVKPVNANDIVLPTDGYKAPTDLERVFLGQLQSGRGEDRPKPRMVAPPDAVPAIGALTPAPAAPAPAEPANKQQPAAALAPPPAPSKKDKGKNGTGAAPGFSFD
jgi:pilus assembly protein CpaC